MTGRAGYGEGVFHRSARHRRRLAGVVAATIALLTGCGAVPADAEDTTTRVDDGELRVGITHNPPWTDTTVPNEPTGSEVGLVEDLATQLDADISWTVGAESVLAEALHRGDLDLVVGGFTDDTPWTDRVAMTTPYAEARDAHGDVKAHVLLTRAGENRFLVTVETFLADHGGSS